MVVACVGFFGAYLSDDLPEVFRPECLFLAGTVATFLVTGFTFVPSLLFILAGRPLVETTHNELRLAAPITANTAAVVGVILNLALFFGNHIIWPQGVAGSFDWTSALITRAAAGAPFRIRQNVIRVIAACTVVGLLIKTLL